MPTAGCVSFDVWFCGLSSVPVSFSQFYLSLDMSGCDASADIMIIYFRSKSPSVILIKLLFFFWFFLWFLNPTKVQTVSGIFCLSPVWQKAEHEEETAVCIYTVNWVFIDILIVESSFNNSDCNYGVPWTLKAIFRPNVPEKTETDEKWNCSGIISLTCFQFRHGRTGGGQLLRQGETQMEEGIW